MILPLDRHPEYKDEAKKKYPKHLIPARPPNNKMTEKGFYAFNVPKHMGKMALMLGLAVLLVIAFMCINIWPLWLKIGIWYVSFYLLVFLVSTHCNQYRWAR